MARSGRPATASVVAMNSRRVFFISMTTKNTSFEAWLPLAAALVSVVLWAGAFVGIRAAGRSFSPGALALGRLTIGSVLLGAIAAMRPFVRPTRRELLLLVLAGLLWFGVYNIALNGAERQVDAGTAALLVRELKAASASGIGWLLFLGIFPTSIAFTTWAYALARGTAGRVVATAYLVPPITIVLSWLILGEVPAAIAIFGGALCLVGVYIARREPAPLAAARSR